MPAQIKYTSTAALRGGDAETVTIERRDGLTRWVCSCGARGRWRSVWLRGSLVGKQDIKAHNGTWWSHVLRKHGPEFE